MINLTLKAKHLFFIAELLTDTVIRDNFRLMNEVKTKLSEIYTGDDDIDVTCEILVEEFLMVFDRLSRLPEGQVTNINAEMLDMLTPQIGSGIQSGNEEWLAVYQGVELIRNDNKLVTDNRIARGKQFLLGI